MKPAKYAFEVLMGLGVLGYAGCGDDIRPGFQSGAGAGTSTQAGKEPGTVEPRIKSLMEGIEDPVELDSEGTSALVEGLQSVQISRGGLAAGEIEVSLLFTQDFADENLAEAGGQQQTLIYDSTPQNIDGRYFLSVIHQSSDAFQSVATCDSENCDAVLIFLKHPDLKVQNENIGSGYLYFFAEEDSDGVLQIQDSNSAALKKGVDEIEQHVSDIEAGLDAIEMYLAQESANAQSPEQESQPLSEGEAGEEPQKSQDPSSDDSQTEQEDGIKQQQDGASGGRR